MTNSKVLLPLRVPELGPSLGKLLALSAGTGKVDWLDPVRHKLVTRLIACGGEARRLAASGERPATVAAIGREIWKQAWDEAVGSAAELLVDRVETHLDAEAIAVRMGRRRRIRLRFTSREKRALTARLGSAGAELIPVLDELAANADRAVSASGLEPEAVRAWQDSLGLAGRRLEAAWMTLQRAVEEEVSKGIARADAVGAWRKPVWPVLVVGTVLVSAGAWFGLVLGGYIAAPSWLSHLWQMVFGA
jgi:hypothetical protein